MKVYTITGFKGHWPVGTAAVVVAASQAFAARQLENSLALVGLPQTIDPKQMLEINVNKTHARILCDGNY